MNRLISLIAFLVSSLVASGCNIVGPAAYIVGGPGSIDAEHALADRPTVVFIDDRENIVNPTSLRRLIAEKVSQDLMTRKVVMRTISPHDAMSLASRHDTHKDVMPVDAVGRAVGAEQIVYVEMLVFQDSEGQVPRPVAACRVRVIDVENRERLYPPRDAERPFRVLEVRMREVNPDLYRSRATRYQISESLANELGDRIAKLFYKHERDLGGRLESR